jgi:hypothetical protein
VAVCVALTQPSNNTVSSVKQKGHLRYLTAPFCYVSLVDAKRISPK